ncbi:hypothetical protein ACR782_06670 [Sphingobacterium spiritivorum]|uniref:hypothetical protein n=1 Tax=Sphingobacterium spiritivorum TaxID=258 RepID=UPI003DA2AB65
MKSIVIRLIFAFILFSTTCANAHTLDSVILKQIGDQLVQLKLQQAEGKTTAGDNCVRDEDGNFLSCYSAESSPFWVDDFNQDGFPDAVFQFMDEGLGGGGNAYGYNYLLVLLDKEHHILNQYSIFGGGKFSYGHLTIDRVEKGKIYTTYNENPMSRSAYDEDDIELKQVNLVFSFQDNKVVEEHYQRCPMADVKKQIFIPNDRQLIKPTLQPDDQFNEEYTEVITLTDSTQYIASLSGCEDLELYFSRTIPFRTELESNRSAIKQELLLNILYLRENTFFKTVLTHTYSQLTNMDKELIETDEHGGTSIKLVLPDKWVAYLFVSGNEEQGSFITIRYERSKLEEAMDFWESMESKELL